MNSERLYQKKDKAGKTEMAKKTDPNQLDMFHQAEQDNIVEKLSKENTEYERKKASLQQEIESTERALNESDVAWQDRREYEDDLRQAQQDLKNLEESHILNVKKIMGENVR